MVVVHWPIADEHTRDGKNKGFGPSIRFTRVAGRVPSRVFSFLLGKHRLCPTKGIRTDRHESSLEGYLGDRNTAGELRYSKDRRCIARAGKTPSGCHTQAYMACRTIVRAVTPLECVALGKTA
jgi:hypothetical protein